MVPTIKALDTNVTIRIPLYDGTDPNTQTPQVMTGFVSYGVVVTPPGGVGILIPNTITLVSVDYPAGTTTPSGEPLAIDTTFPVLQFVTNPCPWLTGGVYEAEGHLVDGAGHVTRTSTITITVAHALL